MRYRSEASRRVGGGLAMRVDEATSSVWIKIGGQERRVFFGIGEMNRLRDVSTGAFAGLREVVVIGLKRGWPEVTLEDVDACDLTVKEAFEVVRIAQNLTVFGTPDAPESGYPLASGPTEL